MKRGTPAHLLTGAFDPDEGEGRRRRLVLLKGLARALCRHGNYAVTILRDVDGGDLAMVAVENDKEAVRFGGTVGARNAERFAPWISHRSFNIDTAMYRRIALVLLANG
jgi:hypothetical protein